MPQLNEDLGGTATDANLAQLESKYGHKLDNLQLTGDGKVDRAQLLNLLSDNDQKFKRTGLLVGTLVLLLALAVAGLAWATAALVTKVSTETTTAHGALVDKANPNGALRVAPGVISLVVTGGNTGAVPPNIPIKGGNAVYVADIDKTNVLDGCRLLLDGARSFTTLIPFKADNNINQATTVEVMYTNTTACKNAVQTGNVDGIYGSVKLNGEQVMIVKCKEDTGCKSYQLESANSTAASGKRRRSLLGASTAYPLQNSGDVAINKVTTRGLLQNPSQAPAPEGDAPEVVTPDDLDNVVEGAAAAGALAGLGQTDDANNANSGSSAASEVAEDSAAEESGGASDVLAEALTTAAEGAECFPRMATVQLRDGTQKYMHQLIPGDRVLSVDSEGQLTYSPVYVLPHAVPRGMFDYRKFTIAAANTNSSQTSMFEASPDHYLLLAPHGKNENVLWSTRRAVRAADAKVGDQMWKINSEKNTLELATILAVEDILDEGIFSPLTLTGTIVVDGVTASVYSDMLGSEYNMHVFCAWGRWLYKIWPQFFTGMHQLKWASPIAMNMGYAARAALKMASMI